MLKPDPQFCLKQILTHKLFLFPWLVMIYSLITPVFVKAELGANNRSSCPTELKPLTTLMLEKLPSYANRKIHSSQALGTTNPRYVIVAGRSEFQALKLNQLQYTPVFSESPEQVFFTTLERQYLDGRVVETENYHWLFLTQTSQGWQLVMMFSRFGSSSENRPPSPPRETSNSAIGQAVHTFLRDCNSFELLNQAS